MSLFQLYRWVLYPDHLYHSEHHLYMLTYEALENIWAELCARAFALSLWELVNSFV